MKNSSVIVTLTCLLSACSSVPPKSSAPAEAPPAIAKIAKKTAKRPPAEAVAAPPGDPLPNVVLTDDLLFSLLTAEIGIQRGQGDAAYMNYMTAAQQTRDPRLARRAAQIALHLRRVDESLAAMRLWHELAPHSDETFIATLIVLPEAMSNAKALVQDHLRQAPLQNRGPMMLQTQRSLSRAKDKAAAFAVLQDILRPYLSTADAHIALAYAASANNDVALARSEALDALRLEPSSQQAALTLSQVSPDKASAAAALTDHLKAHPDAREVRIEYARTLVADEKFDKAREQFEILLKAKPDDAPSIYAVGVLAKQMNDTATAEKYFLRYLDEAKKRPDDELDATPALAALSQMAEDRNDLDGALKWIAQIDNEEAYFGAQLKRAQLLSKRGDVTGARAVLSALKVDDERDRIQVIRADAQILRDANRPQEAMKLLEAALKQAPDNTDVLYDYAMAAEKIDRIDLMETALRHMIEVAPDNQHAYNALGYSLADRNLRLDEAFTLISKALQLAPEDPFIMDSMGWVQFKMGKLDDAEQYLQRAYKLRPDPEIAVHLGEVLWKRGQRADAQKLWREAQSKDPKNDTLKNTLARLNVKL